MNDRQKMVEELMHHPLKSDDEFLFRCDQCGECCKDRADILLSPFDLCRISKALEEPLPDAMDKYGFLFLGETSKFPLVSLVMREDNGRCPFLNDDNRCGIHMYKPSVCALFPLGRCASRQNDRTDIFYILQPTDCGYDDEIHTPRGWMGGINLEESEQWFAAWQDIVMEISERIREILPKLPGELGNEMLSGIAQILYLRYHVDQPLLPQVKENGILAGKMISMLENTIMTYQKS